MKKPLIIIAGPTATGKTDVSIKLAKKIGGAVISADSMQVYKGMNIGSAKVKPEEMDGVDHYLIDVLDPKEEFHVVRFQQMAKEALEQICAKGQIPILTGGTGFYIQALLYDIDFGNVSDEPELRENYYEYAEKYGTEGLHDLLKKVDTKAAKEIHPNNLKRVIRALEYYKGTGRVISEHNAEQKKNESPYHFDFFVLTDDRAKLYKRIDERVERMFEDGLEAEVRALYESGMKEEDVSMKGIGYREFFALFKGEADISQVKEQIKTDTRHFAKRQITWFKREKDARWVDIADFKRDPEKIAEYLAERAIKDGIAAGPVPSDPEEAKTTKE